MLYYPLFNFWSTKLLRFFPNVLLHYENFHKKYKQHFMTSVSVNIKLSVLSEKA